MGQRHRAFLDEQEDNEKKITVSLHHGFTCKDDVVPDYMMLGREPEEVAFFANMFNMTEYNQFFINDLERVLYEEEQKVDFLHLSYQEGLHHNERREYRKSAIEYRKKQNSYLEIEF